MIENTSIRIRLLPPATTNFPIITSEDTEFQLSESLPNGHVVSTITAITNEPGATLSYHIAGGNLGQSFNMGPDTGVLTIRSLDYEEITSYRLWVEARDDSTPPLSSYQELVITVLDENDNTPVFDQLYYNTTVNAG